MIQKDTWIKKLQQELVELQQFQNILPNKKPIYKFLYPTVENAMYNMANILGYLEGVNPHLIKFDEGYFRNRHIAMHKTFFNDLHTGTEEGLRAIIKEQGFVIKISRSELAEGIVDSIKAKIKDTVVIDNQFKKIISLGGRYATFNDYLNVVLNNIKGLDETYKSDCRKFFDGFNIIRNKVSHSEMQLSDSESKKMRDAKLGNALTPDGRNIQMTFEGYKLLVGDIVSFFDYLYARL